MSSQSKAALLQFSLLVAGIAIGLLAFPFTLGFNDRSTHGGVSLKLSAIPVQRSASGAGSEHDGRSWISRYDTFFAQMNDPIDKNVWGFIMLSPKFPPPATTDSVTSDESIAFFDGTSYWPLTVLSSSIKAEPAIPILIPIDSMSPSQWASKDVSKMSLIVGESKKN
jgi:hypothetical protein